jgi:hypothetical protein
MDALAGASRRREVHCSELSKRSRGWDRSELGRDAGGDDGQNGRGGSWNSHSWHRSSDSGGAVSWCRSSDSGRAVSWRQDSGHTVSWTGVVTVGALPPVEVAGAVGEGVGNAG